MKRERERERDTVWSWCISFNAYREPSRASVAITMRRGALQFEISRIGARSIHLRDKIFRSKYEYYIISAVSAGFSSFRSLAFCSSLSPTVPFFFSFFLRFFFFPCSLRLPNRMPALPQQLDCSSPLPAHRLSPFLSRSRSSSPQTDRTCD